jgi:protein-L-isoaspartate(D-aspartate) O-methyltransferase
MTEPQPWEVEAAELVSSLGPLPGPVADAMRRVPRHRFVPPEFRREAYWDEPLPIGPGATTISAPHMVALSLEWAEMAPGLRSLEVGSGSGYLAALLAELSTPHGSIDAIEIDPSLAHRSSQVLAELGYADRVHVHAADGRLGWPPGAPFDRILVSAATQEIAPAWREQLSADGMMLLPLGGPHEQTFVRLIRRAGRETMQEGPAVRFVPLLGAESRIYRPAE